MSSMKTILEALETLAPTALAESWDNVGLLVGDETTHVSKIMTCLTVTSETLAEAIEKQVGLIVSHHPLPFKPLTRITDASTPGRLLLQAIRAGIAIYSAHTAWDNAPEGINRSLARWIGIDDPAPLCPSKNLDLAAMNLGSGIAGSLRKEATLGELVAILKRNVPQIQPRTTHNWERPVQRIGIVCGSGGSMLPFVAQAHCDAMLTGEATYHQCLEAEANGIALLLIGHFASEFFGMRHLALLLRTRIPTLDCFASEREHSDF